METPTDSIQDNLAAYRREYEAHVKELARAVLDECPVDRDALEEMVRADAIRSPWVVEPHRAAAVVLVSNAAKTLPITIAGPLPKLLELAAFEALSADVIAVVELLAGKGATA